MNEQFLRMIDEGLGALLETFTPNEVTVMLNQHLSAFTMRSTIDGKDRKIHVEVTLLDKP